MCHPQQPCKIGQWQPLTNTYSFIDPTYTVQWGDSIQWLPTLCELHANKTASCSFNYACLKKTYILTHIKLGKLLWCFYSVFWWLQVSLVVNVASECGFTEEHYNQLQQLQRDFGPYHFNVLAFPCNQFGQQEPGSDKEIDSFVRRVYGVSFPLFSKIAVVGTGANNVYKYLLGE